MRRTPLLLALLAAVAAVAQPLGSPLPTLYLPLDDSPTPALAAANGGQPTLGPLTFAPSPRGGAVRLNADLRLPSAGLWNPRQGTFAAWVCPREAGSVATGRYIVSLYGPDQGPESWRHNRFSLYLSGGSLQWLVWDADGKTVSAQASVTNWAAGSWHHVAATWSAEGLGLYIDGKPAARGPAPGALTGVGSLLGIGRDSDGSPDYLDGLLDEVFVYDLVLSPAVIAAAATADPVTAMNVTTPEGGPRAGWWHTGWPFRVPLTLPAARLDRGPLAVEVATGFTAAAARLTGRPATLDPSSCRVVPAEGGEAVTAAVSDGRAGWRLASPTPAGRERRFWLYFRLREYDLSVPLQARRPTLVAPTRAAPLPDFATDTTGAPWDLSKIEHFGDKPEFCQHEMVDGVLRLRVKQDPYFIWGTMWGAEPAGAKPLDIDLDRYHVLEMRLRQSVPQAEWTTFSRIPGGDTLRTFSFPVSGTDWQTVRIDLAREARWRGHASAFRIDPTNSVEATVEIASVRLLAVEAADAGAVECLGWPSGVAAKLAVDLPARAVVGSRRDFVVSVTDAQGQPVIGQPVTVRLDGGGRLEAAAKGSSDGPTAGLRRGLTDARGQVHLAYEASQRAGAAADKLAVTADYTSLATPLTVAAEPGPAARLTVTPARATMLAPGVKTLAVRAQVADSFGNPLAMAGRAVKLSTSAGATLSTPSAVTGADGSISATLTLDPARCWVAWVDAVAEGLAGRSAGVCYTADQRDWGVTMGANGYFRTPNGRGWLPLGGFYANWVSDVPATGEPGQRLFSFVDTNDAQKTAWLKYLADQGVTAMRFMLRAHRPGGMEPMDIGGRVNPELYAEALHYMDLARPFGIRFLLVLHEDYDKPMYVNAGYRERYCLPRWQGEDLSKLPAFQRRFVAEGRLVDTARERYTDADAIACQDQYTTELVKLLAGNPQVFCYELENEQVDVPPAWVNHQCDVIRAADPRTPICMSHGGGGLRTADPLYWRQNTKIDFYTYHLYPGDTVADGTDYGLACDVLARYGRMVGRCMYGESVGDEWGYGAPEAMRRRMARDVVWFSLAEGNPGVFFWNQRGYEVEQFKLARRLTDGLDFGAWQPRDIVPSIAADHPVATDAWFRTAGGGETVRAMSRATQQSLRTGATADYARGGLTTQPRRGPVQPTDGFEAASWSTADASQGLTYVRNVAGSTVWTAADQRQSRILVRTMAAKPCRPTLALPAGNYALTIADLDAGTVTTRRVAGNAEIDLGTTDHDFGLAWRRE
ncbi:MAG: hypothetical protein HZB16_23850 [Armatimonadetes bacterium]|nr:hypothetical protein [Armatimonadota bacterium]